MGLPSLCSTSLEFVPLGMLHKDDECQWLDVHRHGGRVDIPDQRVCLQSTELEGRPNMAGDRRGTHRTLNLYGQAVGEFVALIAQRVHGAGSDQCFGL